jgi:hypothetical protein
VEVARQCGHSENLQQNCYKKRDYEWLEVDGVSEGDVSEGSDMSEGSVSEGSGDVVSEGSEGRDVVSECNVSDSRMPKRRRYATSEERDALKQGIYEWDRLHGGARYNWLEIGSGSEKLKDVPLKTVRRWGQSMLKEGGLKEGGVK